MCQYSFLCIFAPNKCYAYMKNAVLLLLFVGFCLSANADVPKRKMLEQNKMWAYAYHHFEPREDSGSAESYDETVWLTEYWLEGDTVIDGRQYLKMYRRDEESFQTTYYGAFREDEEGRVYMFDYLGDKKDFLMLDFSLQYEGRFENVTPIPETIKTEGRFFRRYRYQGVTPDGDTYDLGFVGVEGIGFQKAGIHYPFEEEPDCQCDYEELVSVMGNDLYFEASAFFVSREIELTEGERQMIAGNNDFAFKLFREARGEKSTVLSPLSITYALGMLNNGAAGKTQQEINQTLGFGEAGADAINSFCQRMLREAATLDMSTKALISNTIFVNAGKGYYLQDGFVAKANEFYDAQPQSRDFNDGQTMDVINKWANDHTEGMIPSIFDKESFNPWAVSYLLNALYFKGAWSDPFEVSQTMDEPFGGGPNVPIMNKYCTDIDYTESDLCQAINLPYGNGAYRMTVFLPREGKTIGDVLESLDGKNWQIKGRKYDIDLKLPRFETDANINLVKPMSDLGMPTAFTPGAEFPYFCNGDEIFIGNMFQVAKIKLDEQGTEAAAVTVIEMADGMPPFAKFYATRPFLYIISEQSTGSIFFIGQYTGNVTAGDTNGVIDTIAEPDESRTGELYNLAGQRLSKAPARGLYLRDGKVVVR